MDIQNKGQNFLIGALTGGVIAALTTLFFTTKTGKKMQNELMAKYHELEDDAKEAFFDSKDKIKHAGKRVAKRAAHKAHKIEEKAS